MSFLSACNGFIAREGERFTERTEYLLTGVKCLGFGCKDWYRLNGHFHESHGTQVFSGFFSADTVRLLLWNEEMARGRMMTSSARDMLSTDSPVSVIVLTKSPGQWSVICFEVGEFSSDPISSLKRCCTAIPQRLTCVWGGHSIVGISQLVFTHGSSTSKIPFPRTHHIKINTHILKGIRWSFLNLLNTHKDWTSCAVNWIEEQT